MPLHARPVIQALQWQMDVFVRFQFHNDQAPFAGRGQHIEHGAIRGREGGYLGIETAVVEFLVHSSDIAYYERLQPPFRVQAPQWLMPCSLCATSGTQR